MPLGVEVDMLVSVLVVVVRRQPVVVDGELEGKAGMDKGGLRRIWMMA